MLKNNKVLLLILLSVLSAVQPAETAERQPVMWSIRSMGMGGAGVVAANTDDALIFNPALLSYIPKLDIDMPVSFGIDQTIIREIGYIVSDLIGEIMGMADITAMSQTLKDWINTEHNIGLDPGFKLTMVSPLRFKDYCMGMGFGIYGNALANLGIGQGVWSPTLDVDVTADGIAMGGLAFEIYSPIELLNPVMVGLSAKYLMRAKVDRYESLFSMLMESIGNPNYFTEYFGGVLDIGSGLGLDLGFLYKWSDGDAGLGLTLRNLGGLKLNYESGQVAIPATVDLGWGCNYGRWILACDVMDILGGGDFPKKIHIGAELPGNILTLRGGFSSGWPTAGARVVIGLKIIRFILEYAYTANELGTYAGQWANYYHRASFTVKFF